MKIYKHALFAGTLMLLMFTGFNNVQAQTTDELKNSTTVYSNDFLAYMKKLTGEKNLKVAGGLCKEITSKLSPRLQDLNTKTESWKKSHSVKEYTDLVIWAQKKTRFMEAYGMVNSPALLVSATQDSGFMQAYFNMKHDLLAPQIMTLATE